MTVFGGLRGTGDFGTDELPEDFREMILWLNPNGTSPINALLSRAGSSAIGFPSFNWWSEPNDLVRLQVNGAVGSTAADVLITVDSVDPSAANLATRYGTALNLTAGDVLLVEPAADSATFDHEALRVTQVFSATQFTVERGFQGTTIAAIGNDVFLLKIGSSFAEGTGLPESTGRNPILYNQKCQIFKTPFEITGTLDSTTTSRTGDPLTNDKKRKAFEHSRDIETALLFGRLWEGLGSNNKPMRTMAGLRAFIPAQILAANWSIANPATAGNSLIDAISPVWDWDSEGAGDTRIAFCGNGALNRINAALHKSSGVGATTIQFQGGATAYKMNFQTVQFPQGTIMLKTHPLMSRHPIYTYGMFILDFSAMKWRHMPGRDTHSRMNVQNEDEDLRRGYWMTEGGLEVHHGGLTMKYIGGFDAAIA